MSHACYWSTRSIPISSADIAGTDKRQSNDNSQAITGNDVRSKTPARNGQGAFHAWRSKGGFFLCRWKI
jgi:hypothetical protein